MSFLDACSLLKAQYKVGFMSSSVNEYVKEANTNGTTWTELTGHLKKSHVTEKTRLAFDKNHGRVGS